MELATDIKKTILWDVQRWVKNKGFDKTLEFYTRCLEENPEVTEHTRAQWEYAISLLKPFEFS